MIKKEKKKQQWILQIKYQEKIDSYCSDNHTKENSKHEKFKVWKSVIFSIHLEF